RTVVTIDLAIQHPQKRHLLSAMMRCVRNPPNHDPRATAGNAEENRVRLPPVVIFASQCSETLNGAIRIATNKASASLRIRKRRQARVDAEHGFEPSLF